MPGRFLGVAAEPVNAREAARRWARVWEENWRRHDAAAIVALYSDGARFRSHPFRPPEPPGDYVGRVFADERSTEPWFGEPLVDGDRAAVEWEATTHLTDGTVEHLRGVSLLRFDEAGRVVEQRDFWNRE